MDEFEKNFIIQEMCADLHTKIVKLAIKITDKEPVLTVFEESEEDVLNIVKTCLYCGNNDTNTVKFKHKEDCVWYNLKKLTDHIEKY